MLTALLAAGAQGGSVVNHLLKEGAWRVRVPTRDPDSAGAMKLQQRGVEIVKADLDRAEDLAAVFADAWAAFAVTVPTWWGALTVSPPSLRACPQLGLRMRRDPSSGPSELHRGTAIAEAARAAGVQVYIWSSLPDVERLSGGKLVRLPSYALPDCNLPMWWTVHTVCCRKERRSSRTRQASGRLCSAWGSPSPAH